jgi:hypothetical protein
VSAGTQIEDRETACGKSDANLFIHPSAAIVGPPVKQRLVHRRDLPAQRLLRISRLNPETGDTAHNFCFLVLLSA